MINHDSPSFIKSAAEWIPIDGSLEAIARLQHNGYIVTIATNQSGLSRGLFDENELCNMHKKMANLLDFFGASIDLIKYCPHLPRHACSCRKPLPGMYLSISNHFSISLEGVPVVGDSLRDLQAAVAVNAMPYLVLTGKGLNTLCHPDLPKHTRIFDNLGSVVDSLIHHE